MEFSFGTDRPDHRMFAVQAGAGLDGTHRCAHGDPALSLVMIGEENPCNCHTDALSGQLQLIVPMCAAPGLFGSALAFIRVHQGPQAADQFVREMWQACEQSADAISSLKAQSRACCEAAFRTGGREHTCGGQGDQT